MTTPAIAIATRADVGRARAAAVGLTESGGATKVVLLAGTETVRVAKAKPLEGGDSGPSGRADPYLEPQLGSRG